MAITPEDRAAITELLSLHGHLMDDGVFDRLDELFAADVVYDLEDFGLGSLMGIIEVHQAAIALGEANPVGHHITNIVLTPVDDNVVHARSKGIGVMADGTSGSVTYEDSLRREGAGWRIAYRKVIARRTPLGNR